MTRVFVDGKVIAQGDLAQVLEMQANGLFPKSADLSELIQDKNLAGRRAAYVSESDPLYTEYQYDQTPEKEKIWRDKVLEIKTRFPLEGE